MTAEDTMTPDEIAAWEQRVLTQYHEEPVTVLRERHIRALKCAKRSDLQLVGGGLVAAMARVSSRLFTLRFWRAARDSNAAFNSGLTRKVIATVLGIGGFPLRDRGVEVFGRRVERDAGVVIVERGAFVRDRAPAIVVEQFGANNVQPKGRAAIGVADEDFGRFGCHLNLSVCVAVTTIAPCRHNATPFPKIFSGATQ